MCFSLSRVFLTWSYIYTKKDTWRKPNLTNLDISLLVNHEMYFLCLCKMLSCVIFQSICKYSLKDGHVIFSWCNLMEGTHDYYHTSLNPSIIRFLFGIRNNTLFLQNLHHVENLRIGCEKFMDICLWHMLSREALMLPFPSVAKRTVSKEKKLSFRLLWRVLVRASW